MYRPLHQAGPANVALEQAFPLLADGNIPLPVVDESNNFIGVATQQDLLKIVTSGL